MCSWRQPRNIYTAAIGNALNIWQRKRLRLGGKCGIEAWRRLHVLSATQQQQLWRLRHHVASWPAAAINHSSAKVALRQHLISRQATARGSESARWRSKRVA